MNIRFRYVKNYFLFADQKHIRFQDVVINAEKGSIVALILEGDRGIKTKNLSFSKKGFFVLKGDKEGAGLLTNRDVSPLYEKHIFLLGLPVFTQAKRYVGIVTDAEFEVDHFLITRFFVGRKHLWPLTSVLKSERLIIARGQIIAIHTDRVIVDETFEKINLRAWEETSALGLEFPPSS